MAWVFNDKPVATIKGQLEGSSATMSVNGVTTASITPEAAATQINKLLAIGGKAMVVNAQMARSYSEGAIEDE